jgi:hypothetical protein
MDGFNWGNFFVGLIGMVVGTLVLKEAFYLNHHIYFLDFIERKYGPGTGTTAYRLIGLFTCILSILVMFGFVDIVNGGKNLSKAPNSNNTTINQNLKLPTGNTGTNLAP